MATETQPGTDWWTQNGITTPASGQATTGGNPAPPTGATQAPAPQFTNTSTVTPPPGTYYAPGTSTTDPANAAAAAAPPNATTGMNAGGQPDLLGRVTAALQAAGSTDDPNYWVQKISADPNGAGSAWNYWVGRINQGDGAAAVRNGTVQKFNDASTGTNNQFAALANGGLPALDKTPAPYASNPNAPQFSSLATPTDLSTPFTLPTATELTSMPGYQVGLDAGTQQIQRSAAAQGSVLNPGTVQQLNRYGTDYAGTQYANLVGESLAARQQNNSEFQSAQTTNTGLQTNRYSQYLAQNAQALSDYMTNYNVNHTAATDYWSQLKDVSGAGLTAGSALPTG